MRRDSQAPFACAKRTTHIEAKLGAFPVPITVLLLAAAVAPAQDTLQVGLNSAVPCGSWNPYDFTLNETGEFALADSDQVVCRVSAAALGMQPGDALPFADIYAQWPDGTWQDLSLGGYALDTVRFLDHHCVYGTPEGAYSLKAQIYLPGTTVTVWSSLTLTPSTAVDGSSWGRLKGLYR